MLTNAIKEQVIANSKKKVCHFCGKKIKGREITIDHLLPTHRGGTNDLNNLTMCCTECNQEKGCMNEKEYLQYKKVTTNSSLEEKLYIREIIMYNIYYRKDIDFIKLEKFLLLNRREQFIQNTLNKTKNDANIYKKYYTDNSLEILELKEMARRLAKENKELKEALGSDKSTLNLIKDSKSISEKINIYIRTLNKIRDMATNSLNNNDTTQQNNVDNCANSSILYHQNVKWSDIVIFPNIQNNIMQKLKSKGVENICNNISTNIQEIVLYKYNGYYFLIDNICAYIALKNGCNIKSTVITKFEDLNKKQQRIVSNSTIKDYE